MIDLTGVEGVWLRRYHAAERAEVTLVCFPYAGGAASYFHPLSAALSPVVEVLAVQYPGRQDRRREQPIRRLDTLVDRLLPMLDGWSGRHLILFGHSMGAVVAFEVARRLEAAGAAQPAGVIVSGRRSPTQPGPRGVHLLDDAGLIAEIRRVNGRAAELIVDEEMLRLSLPAIRADYAAVETHEHRPAPRLRCPVTAFTGAGDPLVTPDEAAAWADCTAGAFRLRVFDGGHFYIGSSLTAVSAAITDEVERFRYPDSLAGRSVL
ncbi:alpha/beta fold hydrolase [Micromonospora parva]|uniref:thioesterase II family protein n=1 Tax=Micromonospora parva TaxID=1464048 RepID=UPI0033D7B028